MLAAGLEIVDILKMKKHRMMSSQNIVDPCPLRAVEYSRNYLDVSGDKCQTLDGFLVSIEGRYCRQREPRGR
jgi:hypothetical protein